jgi:hypothetical protein
MLALKPFAETHGRSMVQAFEGHPTSQFPYASWVFHPPTRIHVRLLGPCFKTGRLKALCQHLEAAVPGGQERPSRLGRARGIDRVTTPAFIPRAQPMLASTQRMQSFVRNP